MRSIFQKTALLSLLIIAKSLLADGELPALPAADHGFYLGANLGALAFVDQEKTTAPLYDAHNFSTIGVTGGVLLGYDFSWHNQWQLGIEGFINGASVNASAKQNYAPAARYQIQMNDNFGIRLLPGYAFTPTVVGYAILGYAYGQFKINDNGNYGIVHSSFGSNGLQLGLGVKTLLCNHLSLRGNVVYTIYASQTSNGLTTSTPTSVQVYQNNLATLEPTLSLVYNF